MELVLSSVIPYLLYFIFDVLSCFLLFVKAFYGMDKSSLLLSSKGGALCIDECLILASFRVCNDRGFGMFLFLEI